MKKILVALSLMTMTLVGCAEEETPKNQGTLEEVLVEIQTAEELPVGEAITLSAQLSLGDEMVNDADSVEFEVWESGLREEGTMLEGTLTKDGVYEASFTFDHDGVYYMFAHTNVRGIHYMPKQKLIVGNPDMSKVIPDESDNSMSENHH